MAAPAPVDEAPSGYEFSALENKRFTRLAGAMQIVAVLEIVAGLLGAYPAYGAVKAGIESGAVLATLLPAVATLVPVAVGIWTYRAGGHLRLIVSTEGDDIAHLMAAMGELTKLYILQIWLFLLTVGAAIFSLVVHGAFLRLY